MEMGIVVMLIKRVASSAFCIRYTHAYNTSSVHTHARLCTEHIDIIDQRSYR